mgnify:CR=1 FL=1
MEKTYLIMVYNTLTSQYEDVTVSEEVYNAYMRTNWNIKDNTKRFYAHEIQFSSLIGGEEGTYENFQEFIDTEHTPESGYIAKCRRQAGFQGLNTLTPIMRERFLLHCLHGFTTAEIANLQSVSEYAVKQSLKLARAKLDGYFKKFDF